MLQQNSDSLNIQPIILQDSNQATPHPVMKVDTAIPANDSSVQTPKKASSVGDSVVKTAPKKVQETTLQVSPGKPVSTAARPRIEAAEPLKVYQPVLEVDTDSLQTSTGQAVEFPPLPSARNRNSSVWELLILISCLLMIAAVRAFNKRRFNLLIKSFFNARVVPQNLREENAFSNQVVIVLTGIFVLVASILIYRIVNSWLPETGEESFRFFSQIALFVVLVYVLKFSILELLAEVLDKYQPIQEYIYNVLLFNSLLGMALLPLVLSNVLMLKFNRLFLIIGIALIGSIYIYRNWRAIRISLAYHFPVYYIFLYLCTLEILPSIVLIKLLQAQLI